MFNDELSFFIANQAELVKKYLGKILVIQNKSVVGVYDSALEAYIEAQKTFKLGTFMIQPCEQGNDAYTVTISSHEVFKQ